MESRQDVFYLLTVFHNENCLLLGNLGRKKIEFVMDCFGFSIEVGFHYSSKQHYPIESKDVFHFYFYLFQFSIPEIRLEGLVNFLVLFLHRTCFLF